MIPHSIARFSMSAAEQTLLPTTPPSFRGISSAGHHIFMGLVDQRETESLTRWCDAIRNSRAVRTWSDRKEAMARGGAWAEEIRTNIVVIGDYSVLYEHHQVHPTVSVKVTSPFGYTLHPKEKVSADQFAFTTAEAGNFLTCFSVDDDSKGLVAKLNLDWKIGIAAKDWDSVAKREKLEGVELDLVKLDATVQAIHRNLILLRTKESDMRDFSEKANARISWLSMMSLSVCILVSTLQLVHLKQYFRKKKLI